MTNSKITIDEILLNSVSELDILYEESQKHDFRSKKDIYPLTLIDEAKWVNTTPELKISLRKKRQKLIIAAQNKKQKVIKELTFIKEKSKYQDQYEICKVFFEAFNPKVELLKTIINRLFYLNNLLSLADSMLSGTKRTFSKFDTEANLQKDIMNVAEVLELNVKKEGKNFWILCPFHQEKTPSCKFFQVTNSFYCFGCGEGGDVITFVMKIKQCSFIDANKFLQNI